MTITFIMVMILALAIIVIVGAFIYRITTLDKELDDFDSLFDDTEDYT